MTDSRVIHLHPSDNVAVSLSDLNPGDVIVVEDVSIPLMDPVPFGHKFSLSPLSAGDAVYKYGLPIGIMTAPVSAGCLIHVHNLKSNYSTLKK